jgi:hypothetical protein
LIFRCIDIHPFREELINSAQDTGAVMLELQRDGPAKKGTPANLLYSVQQKDLKRSRIPILLHFLQQNEGELS